MSSIAISFVVYINPRIYLKGRNPLVVADETERAAAREVINNTPQAVIDSVSS